jgi:hypothetical protein
MTLDQLYELTPDELALVLVIVNDIAPPASPKMTFEPRHLTWFRHDQLIKKLVDVFPKLKPEGHATYVSLMQKLGVCIQIQSSAKLPEIKPEAEITKSIECPASQSFSSNGSSQSTGSVP